MTYNRVKFRRERAFAFTLAEIMKMMASATENRKGLLKPGHFANQCGPPVDKSSVNLKQFRAGLDFFAGRFRV